MTLRFTKMQGAGNDFILIDCLQGLPLPEEALPALARRLCRRRFCVGADQLLLLLPSQRADFRMRILNSDGSEVQMCGNGIRCLARYIWNRGLSHKDTLEIETPAGIIRPQRAGQLVQVDMGPPRLEAQDIPVGLKGRVLGYPLDIPGAGRYLITCVGMGNPHAVVFVDDVEGFPVAQVGPLIERHGLFPERTNVEFVQVLSPRRLKVRVWERGAGQTLACGTGASAAAVAAALRGLAERRLEVELPGGLLKVHWQKADGHVYLSGPAEEVFRAEMEIPDTFHEEKEGQQDV